MASSRRPLRGRPLRGRPLRASSAALETTEVIRTEPLASDHEWLFPSVLAPYLAIADARRASLVCRAAAEPDASLVLARIASGAVDEAWLYRAIARRRTPPEVVLKLLAAAPAAAQLSPRLASAGPREEWHPSLEREYTRFLSETGWRRQSEGLELPLHAALRLQKPAHVVLALLAAYPAAAGRREEPYERSDERSLDWTDVLNQGYTTYDRYGTFARYGTGALPLVIAIRTGADVEVVRALIEAYPAALRAYSGDFERFFDSDVRGLPLHEAIYHYAAPDVVELLVDAYPEALLEESLEREKGEMDYCPSCCMDYLTALGTPLAIAEELAARHAQARDVSAVHPEVLSILRARSPVDAVASWWESPQERMERMDKRIRQWQEDAEANRASSRRMWLRSRYVGSRGFLEPRRERGEEEEEEEEEYSDWLELEDENRAPEDVQDLSCDRGDASRARIARHARRQHAQRAARRGISCRAGAPPAARCGQRPRDARQARPSARRTAAQARPGRSARRRAALAE